MGMKILRVMGWQTKSAALSVPVHTSILPTPSSHGVSPTRRTQAMEAEQTQRGTRYHVQ